MKKTSIFVTIVTLVSLLPCQGMPPKITKNTALLKQTSSQNTAHDSSVGTASCNMSAITEPPSFITERRIYSERRYFLEMSSDGRRVYGGSTRTFNINNVFLLETMGDGGLFRAKGKNSNKYITMDKKGRIYGRKTPNNESIFQPVITSHGFLAFQSYEYCTKFIGMRRNGQLKATDKINHSSHFLWI